MKTYLVGGAVRDKLLGYPYSEHDWVVTGSSPEQMQELGYTPVGKDFPVFLHPQSKEEYALARTERKSAPGYSGFVFHTAPDITLEEDLQRRDLTINAIAEDDEGNLFDPYNGAGDIEQKLLRHVSDAFLEDPVRILRVARFAARYHHLGFTVAAPTTELMTTMVNNGEADHLVAERVWKEWQRALAEKSPQRFIEVLQSCGALEVIVPELAQRLTTDRLPLERLVVSAEKNLNSRIRLAVLLFDLQPDDNDQLESLCQRLGMPKLERELLTKLARHHHKLIDSKHLNAEELLQLLQALDSFRRPEILQELCQCCSVLAAQKAMTFDHSLLDQALQRCNNVKTNDILAQGISGKAIGEAIHTQRVQALAELLQERT